MIHVDWRGHKHLLSIDDFSREEIEDLLACATILEPYSSEGTELGICRGYILKPVFFEPSSRTIDSFTAAMYTMGGKVQSPHSPLTSSMEKGESEEDTITTYAQYSDFLVVRHSKEYAPQRFAQLLDNQDNRVRVISGGDGSNEHPTQGLLDLYTVRRELGELDGITYLLLGDLRKGRTVHSLVLGARKFYGVKFVGFPVGDLHLPEQYLPKDYEEHDIKEFPQFLKDLHPNSRVVIYATRIQWERIAKERGANLEELEEENKVRIRDGIYGEFNYQVTRTQLDSSPKVTRLLHPLPKGYEISDDLFYSKHPKVAPIRQMRNGLEVRMAILGLYAGGERKILSLTHQF